MATLQSNSFLWNIFLTQCISSYTQNWYWSHWSHICFFMHLPSMQPGTKKPAGNHSFWDKLSTISLIILMLITIMQHWAESITSRFCRRKTNTLSRFSLRAATISLFRGVESPSGNVWISSERRRKISSTSSTWVGLAEESERNENVDWNNDNHTKQLCIQNGQWPAIISNTGFGDHYKKKLFLSCIWIWPSV